MKTRLILTTLLFGFSLIILAQTPKSGAIISLNKYDLQVKSGESLEVPVQLVRSVRFKKGAIDGLVIQQKEGFDMSISEVEDQADLFVLKISAISINPGTYPLIIKAEGKSAYKVKQSMIMLQVINGSQIVTVN